MGLWRGLMFDNCAFCGELFTCFLNCTVWIDYIRRGCVLFCMIYSGGLLCAKRKGWIFQILGIQLNGECWLSGPVLLALACVRGISGKWPTSKYLQECNAAWKRNKFHPNGPLNGHSIEFIPIETNWGEIRAQLGAPLSPEMNSMQSMKFHNNFTVIKLSAHIICLLCKFIVSDINRLIIIISIRLRLLSWLGLGTLQDWHYRRDTAGFYLNICSTDYRADRFLFGCRLVYLICAQSGKDVIVFYFFWTVPLRNVYRLRMYVYAIPLAFKSLLTKKTTRSF